MTLAREYYESAGFPTLPLLPGTKVCRVKGWPDKTPDDLWRGARPDSNIGVRAGGDKAIIDADDDATAEYVLRHFAGLGIDTLPGSVTRRGEQFYVRTEVPGTFHASPFGLSDWTGEVRGNRAYGAAAPSVVAGFPYAPFGDVHQTPLVPWPEITSLLAPQPRSEQVPTCECYDSLFRVSLPREALELVGAIRLAATGCPVKALGKRYASRSEALASLWAKCLTAGLAPREAAALVGPLPGRPLTALEADAQRTYGKLLASRSGALAIARGAALFVLPGRLDAVRNDARVLKASAEIVYQCGFGFMIHASQVADKTGLPRGTAIRSLGRLCASGRMRRGRRGISRKWRGYFLEAKQSEYLPNAE